MCTPCLLDLDNRKDRGNFSKVSHDFLGNDRTSTLVVSKCSGVFPGKNSIRLFLAKTHRAGGGLMSEFRESGRTIVVIKPRKSMLAHHGDEGSHFHRRGLRHARKRELHVWKKVAVDKRNVRFRRLGFVIDFGVVCAELFDLFFSTAASGRPNDYVRDTRQARNPLAFLSARLGSLYEMRAASGGESR